MSALLAFRKDVNMDVKNLEGNTPWDILEEQTQVDNMEIRIMLQRIYYKTGWCRCLVIATLLILLLLLLLITVHTKKGHPWVQQLSLFCCS